MQETEESTVRQKTKRPYDKLSFVYHRLMRNVDFNVWSDYVLEIAKSYTHSNSSFLEIAAGTCRMANKIKNTYPDLIATDQSFNMMSTEQQSSVTKVCCNMLNMPFKKEFDFIYCTFDSVNYLLTEKELLLMFSEIKTVLDKKGTFTFDVSLENNSLEFAKVQVSEDNYNGYGFKRINSYNKRTRIHKNIFHIFSHDGIRYKEIHKQKIYKFETYFRLIEKAGLFVKECYNGFSFDAGTAESERVQFVVGNFTV